MFNWIMYVDVIVDFFRNVFFHGVFTILFVLSLLLPGIIKNYLSFSAVGAGSSQAPTGSTATSSTHPPALASTLTPGSSLPQSRNFSCYYIFN